MVDTPRISSVLALILLSWGVIEASNFVFVALNVAGIAWLLMKCAAVAVVGLVAGLALSRWALDEWTTTAALPFAVVAPFIAVIHLVNYFSRFSLTVELGVMIVGAFAVHGVLAALEQDDIGSPPG